jgi:hypothetical protein
MAMARDDRDPLQKLKDLHEWLMSNSPAARIPVKVPVQSTWAVPISDKAVAEVQDFQNWVKEIQSPKFVL